MSDREATRRAVAASPSRAHELRNCLQHVWNLVAAAEAGCAEPRTRLLLADAMEGLEKAAALLSRPPEP